MRSPGIRSLPAMIVRMTIMVLALTAPIAAASQNATAPGHIIVGLEERSSGAGLVLLFSLQRNG